MEKLRGQSNSSVWGLCGVGSRTLIQNSFMEDFIGIYDNVLTQTECDKLIAYYNQLNELNRTFNRQELKDEDRHVKDDETAFLMESEEFFLDQGMSILNPLVNKISKCYEDYANRFSVIKSSKRIGVHSLRLQKTVPGGGYHMWHYETSSHGSSPKFITFMVYLNDIDEGGETEFLYLHKRIKPQQGRVIIWPSGFTHTHRGNTPLSGIKYAITGWVSYFE